MRESDFQGFVFLSRYDCALLLSILLRVRLGIGSWVYHSMRVCLLIIAVLLLAMGIMGPMLMIWYGYNYTLEQVMYCFLLAILLGHLLISLLAQRRALWVLALCCMTLVILDILLWYGTQYLGPDRIDAVWGFLYVSALLMVLSFIAIYMKITEPRIHSIKKGYCIKCGYDLRGLPEPRCPECGTPFDRNQDHNSTVSPSL